MNVGVVTFGVVAVLFVALGLPMWWRKVPPNMFYGFRTAATMGDEKLWYEVNAKSGFDMIAIGLGLGAIVIARVMDLLWDKGLVLSGVAWLLLGAVWSVVRGFRTIRKWKRDAA